MQSVKSVQSLQSVSISVAPGQAEVCQHPLRPLLRSKYAEEWTSSLNSRTSKKRSKARILSSPAKARLIIKHLQGKLLRVWPISQKNTKNDWSSWQERMSLTSNVSQSSV